MPKDYYQTLGVSKSASADEVKRAFRALAHQYHPDKKTGDEKKFKEINEAYQVLGDPEKRAKYDQFGSAAFEQGGAGGFGGFDFSGFNGAFNFGDIGDLGDMFGGMFGGGRRASRTHRGEDIAVDVTLTFQEMVTGVKKSVSLRRQERCSSCKGTGAKDEKTDRCRTCDGQGTRTQTVRTMLGAMRQQTTCDDCHGRGQVPKQSCRSCGGTGVEYATETMEVHVPAGMEDGQMLRLRGKGHVPPYGGEAGDAFVRVFVKEDPRFEREGDSLHTQVTIGFTQAALGDQVSVPTVDGVVDLTIPEGIQSGTVLRLRGKGIHGSHGRGDQLVHVVVETPKRLSHDQKELLQKLNLKKS
jgi:molecular chaperone DnaJ